MLYVHDSLLTSDVQTFDDDMANILQEQFYSAFSDPDSPDIEQTMITPQGEPGATIADINFTKEDIELAIAEVSDIQTIEDVQRNFTRRIAGTGDLDYWERLSALNLLSLQRRRERYMIIHVWKILNETTPNDIGMQFTDNMRQKESKDTGYVRRGPARVPESNVRKQHTGFATPRAGSGVHRRRGCLTARGAESNVRKQRTSFTARPAESTVRKQLPCTRI
ncbi:unnamed protein product [Gadus morhua 'NCC']